MFALLAPFRRHLGPESIREVVFGVEDGLVQNMTLVAGMAGADLGSGVIVLAGAVNAMAGMLSMSTGTYLSSQAERDALRAAARAGAVERSPLRDALVMAFAYGSGALAPLLGFAVPSFGLVTAIGITAVGLFLLGVFKAHLSGGDPVRSGLQLLLLASAAGWAGYGIGVGAGALFGVAT
jgi:VIT1/CCC1 family predicted Fe2+/Mn2+ transporter